MAASLYAPSEELWKKINQAILGENGAVVLATMMEGMVSFCVSARDDAGVPLFQSRAHARVHLAATMISPKEGIGALLPLLEAELDRLRSVSS